MKTDDDIFVIPQRIHLAAQQWTGRAAGKMSCVCRASELHQLTNEAACFPGYVGCMRYGTANIPNTSKYYHESQRYFDVFPVHSYGGFYALARTAAQVLEDDGLRSFFLEGNVQQAFGVMCFRFHVTYAFADVSMGIWMLAHKITFLDDLRTCHTQCNQASIAVWTTACAGLCDKVGDHGKLMANRLCTLTKGSLPWQASSISLPE